MNARRFITAILKRLGRSRIGRSVLGFLTVLAVFTVYSISVVPLIEPGSSFAANSEIIDEKIRRAKEAVQRRLSRFDALLQSCSIQMRDPKILESEQITLLFRSYENNPEDGTVLVKPFLLIYLPDDPEMTEKERIAAATVLEAKNGAKLAFDSPFDLSRGKVGQIVGGTLDGEVTIRGRGKVDGPEDDLLIVARDIELTEDEIISRQRVAFQYGPHRGEGSEMTIRLRKNPGDADSHAPRISGIESFSMARVHELHLRFDNPDYESDKSQSPYLPVDVKCQGALTFRTMTRQATFEDGVDVLLGRSSGESDHLSCQMLLIHFADKHETNLSKQELERKRKEGDILDLEPYRIEARGTPVRLLAPSYQLSAEGEILDYDFGTQRVLLESRGTDAVLQYGDSRLDAKKLQYHAAEDGRLGEIRAEGPGTLRGLVEREAIHASWGRLLQVRPDMESDNGQLVSLTGGVILEYADIGKLQSDKVYLWLRETGQETGEGMPELRPDRMLAEEGVTLRSEQMVADLGKRVEIWFEEVAEDPLAGAVPIDAPTVPVVSSDGWRHSGPDATAAARSGAMVPVNPRQANPYYTPPEARAPKQQFHVEGQVLQVNLRVFPERTSVAKLVLEGGARLRETQTAAPDEEPILVEGNLVNVLDADAPHASVTVVGTQDRPALFQGRGLSLQSSTISLNRGTNSLRADAAGILQVKINQDKINQDKVGQGNVGQDGDRQPIKIVGPLTIEWQSRMSFDGQTARFEDAVTASTQFQHLRTQTLSARLKRPISFSSNPGAAEPEIAEIDCCGGVTLENHLFDPIGRVSKDKIEVADLKMNLLSGNLTASGPAEVTTVRREFNDPTRRDSEKTAIPLRRGEGPKTYLHVRCEGPISGNIDKREIAFNEQVKTVFGPVGTWDSKLDPNNPDVLDDRGAVLSCDRMSVAQMAVPGADPAIELEATGNVVVEGRTFMARGARVSYAQAKDLLILEGDGRNDAELFRQMTVGGPTNRTALKKIHYSLSSKRGSMDGMRGGEFEVSPRTGLRQDTRMPGRR